MRMDRGARPRRPPTVHPETLARQHDYGIARFASIDVDTSYTSCSEETR